MPRRLLLPLIPCALSLLIGAAGIALGVAWMPRWISSAVQAPAPPAQLEPVRHAVRRCPHCGWIEAKREIVPDVADSRSPKIYEYTARMGDGSSRVFQEPLPVSWRLGERLTIIDGVDPRPH